MTKSNSYLADSPVQRKPSIFRKNRAEEIIPNAVMISHVPSMSRKPSRLNSLKMQVSESTRNDHPIRSRTLIRRDSVKKRPLIQQDRFPHWWLFISRILTFWCPMILLDFCGMKDAKVRQAFREKLAICVIAICCIFIVGFLSFGTTVFICSVNSPRFKLYDIPKLKGSFAAHGNLYSLSSFKHPGTFTQTSLSSGNDASFMFQKFDSTSCAPFLNGKPVFPCILKYYILT